MIFENENIKLYNGDCLEIMKNLPDNSVDMILCDLPYGTTDCGWDSIIPYDELWAQYRRIIQPNGSILLFSAQPFTTKLIANNLANYKYTWYWLKNNVTGFAFAKCQPMRRLEEINVFRFDLSQDNKGYFPKCREYLQSEKKKCGKTLKELQKILGSTMTSHYFTNGQQFSLPTAEAYEKLQTTDYFKMPYEELKALYESEGAGITRKSFTYNPQGLRLLDKPIKKNRYERKDGVYIGDTLSNAYTQKYTGYPSNVLKFDNDAQNGINRLHPTQKPINLLEYLVKTYTNGGEVVLDNCMGSGSTGVACMNTGRKFIGIELDRKYYEIARERINDAPFVVAEKREEVNT